MTVDSAASPSPSAKTLTPADWVGLGVLAVFLLVGLSWSKWLPYWDKAWALSRSSPWDGAPLFDAAGEACRCREPGTSLSVHTSPQCGKPCSWRCDVAAVIDALGAARDWLLRLLNRRSHARLSLSSVPPCRCRR